MTEQKQTPESSFLDATSMRPVLYVSCVPKAHRASVGNKYAAFIRMDEAVFGGAETMFVLPVSMGSMREVMAQTDKLRMEYLATVHDMLVHSPRSPVKLREIPPDYLLDEPSIIEMCPFSGIVNYGVMIQEPAIIEIMAACASPSMFTGPKERDAILAGSRKVSEDVIRTLSGVFLFVEHRGVSQVNHWDMIGMTAGLIRAGIAGEGALTETFVRLVDLLPPDSVNNVMDEIWKNRTPTEDTLPESLHAALRWGRTVLEGNDHVHLTILNQTQVAETGKAIVLGTFSDDNREHFMRFWNDILRNIDDGVIDQVMVNKRVFTKMTDIESGHPVKRLSSFLLGKEGIISIPKDILKIAFNKNAKTGEPLEPTTDIVYQDFSV